MDTKTCSNCRTVNAGSAIACANCGAVIGVVATVAAVPATSAGPSPAAREPAPVGPLTAARHAAAAGAVNAPVPPVPPMPTSSAGDLDWSTPAVSTGRIGLPPKKTGGALPVVAGAVVLVVAAAAAFTFLRGGGGLPDELAGLPRSNSEIATQLEEALSGIEIMGVSFDVGFYGDGLEPQIVLMVFEGLPDELASAPSDMFFEGFASGFASTSGGATVGFDAAVQRTADGVDYMCAPVEGPESGVVCLFRGEGVGMLVTQTTTDANAAVAIAQEAHAAVA
jgi:hypothetical protein